MIDEDIEPGGKPRCGELRCDDDGVLVVMLQRAGDRGGEAGFVVELEDRGVVVDEAVDKELETGVARELAGAIEVALDAGVRERRIVCFAGKGGADAVEDLFACGVHALPPFASRDFHQSRKLCLGMGLRSRKRVQPPAMPGRLVS